MNTSCSPLIAAKHLLVVAGIGVPKGVPQQPSTAVPGGS